MKIRKIFGTVLMAVILLAVFMIGASAAESFTGGGGTNKVYVSTYSELQEAVNVKGNYVILQNDLDINNGGDNCITMYTESVTLDLDGYAILDNYPDETDRALISVQAGDIVIRNGFLYGTDGYSAETTAVEIMSSSAKPVVLHALTVQDLGRFISALNTKNRQLVRISGCDFIQYMFDKDYSTLEAFLVDGFSDVFLDNVRIYASPSCEAIFRRWNSSGDAKLSLHTVDAQFRVDDVEGVLIHYYRSNNQFPRPVYNDLLDDMTSPDIYCDGSWLDISDEIPAISYSNNTQFSLRGEYLYIGSGEAEHYVHDVSVGGIDSPLVGNYPDYSAVVDSSSYMVAKDSSGNYVNGVYWKDETENRVISSTETFKVGHIYSVWVKVSPVNTDFYFAPTAHLNLLPACAYYEDGNYIVRYEFPKVVAPPTVKLENALDGVKISWNKIEGASYYNVYKWMYDSEYDGYWDWMTSTSALSVTDSDTVGADYLTYYVAAVMQDGTEGPASDEKTIVYMPAPKVTDVVNSYNGVKVSWSWRREYFVYPVSKYVVYRKGPGETSFKKLDVITETETGVLCTGEYTDKTAVHNTEYKYSVRAVEKGGATSAYAASKSIRYFQAPTIQVENALTGVKISWNKISGAVKYYICRKGPGESGFTLIASTTDTTYTNKGVTSGKEYRYSIRAVPATGKMSGMSAGKSILYLKAPTISVKNTSSGVVISWGKITGAGKYYVYRKGPGESGFTKLAGAIGTQLTDTKVTSGKEYRYSVRAVTSDGSVLSAFSAGQSITYKKP